MTPGLDRMSEPDPRPHLVIATWFYDEQPGFLDFKYRIAALSRHYRVTLVLRHARFIIEFSDLQLDICVLEAPRTGKLALLRYCQRLACWLRGSEASAVVLLGSQLALTRFMLPERLPCLLYWNEHPTHFFWRKRRPQGQICCTSRAGQLPRCGALCSSNADRRRIAR